MMVCMHVVCSICGFSTAMYDENGGLRPQLGSMHSKPVNYEHVSMMTGNMNSREHWLVELKIEKC